MNPTSAQPQPTVPAVPTTQGGRATTTLRYGVGMLGTSLPINLIRGSMLYFYVQLLGLSQTTFAAVYVIYGIIDAIDNPIFGYFSDRTRSRWGRRRPYLAIGAVLLAISSALLFTVPDTVAADATTLVIWFAIFAILSEAADSMVLANYGALMPELFPEEKRRTEANAIRQGFQLLAMVIALGLTPVLARSVLGCDVQDLVCIDPAAGYSKLAIIYGITAAIIILYMVAGIRENLAIQQQPKPQFFSAVRSIITNRHFWTVGLVSACYGGGMALVLGGLQMYVDYALDGQGSTAALLQVTVIGAALSFLPLWLKLSTRFGPDLIWRASLLLGTASFLPLLWVQTRIGACLVAVWIAAAYSGMLATNDLMLNRVLDDDAARHGVNREGVFLSVFGILGRVGGILLAIASASLTWFFGFESGHQPGPNPELAWRVYMGIYPMILFAAGTLISRWVKVPAPAKT